MLKYAKIYYNHNRLKQPTIEQMGKSEKIHGRTKWKATD
jgi:hypothetical protein